MLKEGVDLLHRVLEREPSQIKWVTANARLALSIHSRMHGRFHESRLTIREVRAWARENNFVRTEILCHEYLGDAWADDGEQDRALRAFNKALRLGREKYPDTDMICEVQRRRAELLVEMGEIERARRAAREAVKVSRKIEEPYEIALAIRARGIVQMALGKREKALADIESAARSLRSIGDRFELARTLLHLSDLVRIERSPAEGMQIADEARRLFDSMGLDFWSRRAQDVLAGRTESRLAGAAASRQDLPSPNDHGIITQDERIISMFGDLSKIAGGDLSVILEGESGTGKELFARAIHAMSARSGNAFVALNCGAIPRDMQESELFGHAKGAFTGAIQDKVGYFEAADKGTLFLDEIGEMSPGAQVRLLRVIENGEFCRVGETRLRRIDVRYVAATNVNLDQAAASGDFRSDLYFRLKGLRLRIPPLRDRRGDIPLLVRHFVEVFRESLGKKVGVPSVVMNHLMSHDWPGNVRELRQEIHRAVTLADPDGELSPAHFSFLQDAIEPGARTIGEDLTELEKRRIIRALEDTHWNKAAAARQLGTTRTTLTSRMERLGIPLRKSPRPAR